MKFQSFIYIPGLVLLTLLLVMNGCNDKLNVNPTAAVDQSVGAQNVQATLEGAYSLLGSGNNQNTTSDGFYGAEVIMIPDLLVADNYLNWSGTYNQYRNIVNKQMVSTNTAAAALWARAYQCIGTANTVLANLQYVTDSTQQAQYKAEAMFIRGVVYFELVRLFAQQWVPGGANTQPGVPIVLTPTATVSDLQNDQIPRASVAEVYAQVIADLTYAKNNLPASNGYHANTFVASGFLSRVYLQQNDYANALNEANRVITQGQYGLTVAVAQIYNTGSRPSTESIFEIQQTEQNNAGVSNGGLYAFYGCDKTVAAGPGRGDINPDSTFYNLYTDGDQRKTTLFYVGSCTKSGRLTTDKWHDPYSNYLVMRLGEMYLTRAECNYRLNSALGDTPLNDLNRIKARAGAPQLPAITSINDILLERKLELAYEGFGVHDLRRTQGTLYSYDAQGNLTDTYLWNDPRLVLPIPLREMNVNSKLVQNEGYQ